jgi:malate dehydrogenase (oxaloacetate-decarboxylating)
MLKTSEIPKKSLALHKKLRGKISIVSKAEVKTREDLSLIYSPGVGAASSAIAKDPKQADALTWRRNAVAVDPAFFGVLDVVVDNKGVY